MLWNVRGDDLIRSNSIRSFAMRTWPEKCFFTRSPVASIFILRISRRWQVCKDHGLNARACGHFTHLLWADVFLDLMPDRGLLLHRCHRLPPPDRHLPLFEFFQGGPRPQKQEDQYPWPALKWPRWDRCPP